VKGSHHVQVHIYICVPVIGSNGQKNVFISSEGHISVGMYLNLNQKSEWEGGVHMWNVMTQDIPIIMQAQTAHTNYKV
jgi:hypothetical protein